MMRWTIGVMLTLLVAGLVGCEQRESATRGENGVPTTQPAAEPTTQEVSFEEVKRRANETVAAAVRLLRKAREEYGEDVERELKDLDRRAQDLAQKLRDARDASRPKVERHIEKLKKNVEVARDKLDRLRDASDDAWKEAQEGLDAALEEFRRALEEEAPATQPA